MQWKIYLDWREIYAKFYIDMQIASLLPYKSFSVVKLLVCESNHLFAGKSFARRILILFPYP